MNYHCCRRPPLDPLFPYIFYTNKDVKNHNEQMLTQADGELICLEAIDQQECSNKNFMCYEKYISLPSQILLKSNMLIELFAGNYNIEDGLVNGADGIFRTYTRNKNELDIIWIEFVDPSIGTSQRKRFNELYDKYIKST